jgi:methionyl-tRNA formyltransferase
MGAVFLGTPSAAVPSLCALAQIADVDLVVTQPDRPQRRSSADIASPVKVAASQFGFRVEQPSTAAELATVMATQNARFGLVVAYGRILSPELIAMLPMGVLNIHFSLLPRWRGAAPVERAIAAGDETTGVTLMKIDSGLDTGPVIAERVTTIAETETGGSLTARLAHLGAGLVDAAVPDYLSGRRLPVPQIDRGANHAARLKKADARIDPGLSASHASRIVRAFNPRPGAWVETDAGLLKIHAATPAGPTALEPGTIAVQQRNDDSVVTFALREGSIHLTTVQPAGKPAMPAASWMNGRRGEPVRVIAP